jgi:hypothetical protein
VDIDGDDAIHSDGLERRPHAMRDLERLGYPTRVAEHGEKVEVG